MGLEIVVPIEGAVPLAAAVARLDAAGTPCLIVMVDGNLQAPGAPPPAEGWRDVRLGTPAGTVTLARRPGGVAVVVFGNADDALREMQRRVADALVATASG